MYHDSEHGSTVSRTISRLAARPRRSPVPLRLAAGFLIGALALTALTAGWTAMTGVHAAGTPATGGGAVAGAPAGTARGVVVVPGLAPCPPDDDNQNAPPPGPPPAPAAPSGTLAMPSLTLSAASDTGSSNSDRLTGNNMPTFEGQAPAGSQVSLFDGQALFGAAAADGQGRWSYMVNECQAFDDGPHTITAQARDGSGQVSRLSAGLVITILTKAPAMPVIDAPAQNSHARAGRLTISGTGAPNVTIQVLDGSKTLSSTRTDARGVWNVALNGLAAGPHAFRAQAVDAAGNTSPAFNTHTVIADATP